MNEFSLVIVDNDRIKVFWSHPMGDFSWKSFRHHLQMYEGDRFRRFDYGLVKNVTKYGTVSIARADPSLNV